MLWLLPVLVILGIIVLAIWLSLAVGTYRMPGDAFPAYMAGSVLMGISCIIICASVVYMLGIGIR